MAGPSVPGRGSASSRFPDAPHSAGQAREWARPLLLRWGADGSTSDALLVLSELVANAVRHGSGGVDVRMSLQPPILRIEVADGDADPIRPPTVEEDPPTSGRGLHIVRELSDRWGVDYHHRAKTVWAELRV